MQVYSINEVAAREGITKHGVLWWVKNKNIECCETGNGRKFFTPEQLENFKQRRAGSEKARHKMNTL